MLLKKTIEVVSNTNSSLIEKSSMADIAELEAYTICCMDEKLPLGSDIDHYKMLKVEEPALDSRLKFLDVLYFPTLSPLEGMVNFIPEK